MMNKAGLPSLSIDSFNNQERVKPVINTDLNQDKYLSNAEAMQMIESKRRASRLGTLEEIYALDADCLLKAPAGFFNKYNQVVKNLTLYIQNELSAIGEATLIEQLRRDPTCKESKERAFNSINACYLKYDSQSRDREYAALNTTEKMICLAMSFNEICGIGPLEPLYNDFKIREIIANGPYDIQVEIKGRLKRVPSCQFRDETHLMDLISKLYASVNKSLSRSNPFERCRLKDNSRVFATHQAIAPDGPNLNIRRHPDNWTSPEELMGFGTAPPEVFEWLGQRINAGMSWIVNGGTSTGKSLALDTPIPTPNGFKLMRDIIIGDIVYDKNGKTARVENVFEQPPRNAYIVNLSNGSEIKCDLEHNWDTLNKITGEFSTLTTREIIEANNKDIVLPALTAPIEYEDEYNIDNLDIHPYLMGLWFKHRIENASFSIKINDEKLVKTYNERLKQLNIKFSIEDNNDRSDDIYHIVPQEEFSELIKEYKCIDSKSKYPDTYDRLPIQYMFSDSRCRESFARGLIDPYNIKIVNFKYPNLNRDAISVITSLGYNIIQNSNTIDFSNNGYVEIVRIEPTNNKEVMKCITVSSPTKTFLAGAYHTVTHNTTLLSALCGYLPNNKRIITIEKNIEIKMPNGKMLAAAMETIPKKSSSSSSNEVTMTDLVECTTQMRPDVIICGEIVGAEAYDFVQAANTGHQASTSVHSNSTAECTYRMMSLISQSEMVKGKEAFELLSAGIDVIVTVKKFQQDGSRKIVDISEVGTEVKKNSEGVLYLPVNTIWTFQPAKTLNPTDPVTGEWIKVGDLSPERTERLGLNYTVLKSLDELKALYQPYNIKKSS